MAALASLFFHTAIARAHLRSKHGGGIIPPQHWRAEETSIATLERGEWRDVAGFLNRYQRIASKLAAPPRRLIGALFSLSLLAIGSLANADPSAAALSSASSAAGRVLRLDPALDELIAPKAAVELVATGFGPTEGPIWRNDRLWISDMQNDRTIAIRQNGQSSVVAKGTGGNVPPIKGLLFGPNGMLPYRDGVLICRQGARDIAFFHKGRIDSFVSTYRGKRLNSPNDMILAGDGAIWFTDPAFSVPGGTAGPEPDLPFEGVYRYYKGELKAVITDLVRPNGIALTADGHTLYVSSGFPGHNVIRAYTVGHDGDLSQPRDFAKFPDNAPGDTSVPMDGMKLDDRGNLWATGPGGINIITPNGHILGQIQVSGHTTANLVFGGRDGKTLFIVGASNVYRLPVLVGGQKHLSSDADSKRSLAAD